MGTDSEKGLIIYQLSQILPGHGTGKALSLSYLNVPIILYQVEIIANVNYAPSVYTNCAGCFLFLIITITLPTQPLLLAPFYRERH